MWYTFYLSDDSSNGEVMQNFTIPDASSTSTNNNRSNVLAIVHPSNNLDISSYSASNGVLDPQYAAMEPSPPECDNFIFGRRFGVLVEHVSKF